MTTPKSKMFVDEMKIKSDDGSWWLVLGAEYGGDADPETEHPEYFDCQIQLTTPDGGPVVGQPTQNFWGTVQITFGADVSVDKIRMLMRMICGGLDRLEVLA